MRAAVAGWGKRGGGIIMFFLEEDGDVWDVEGRDHKMVVVVVVVVISIDHM